MNTQTIYQDYLSNKTAPRWVALAAMAPVSQKTAPFYKQISVNGDKYNIYAEHNCEVDGHTQTVLGITEEKGYMWIDWSTGIKVVGDDGEEKGDYVWKGDEILATEMRSCEDKVYNDIQGEVCLQWEADGGICIDSNESCIHVA